MEDGGFVLTDVPYGEMDAFAAEKKAEYEEGAKALGIGG
jgi:hypothetical protein